MTSALVVPVSGYSTLSRFDSVSRRPSTSTVVPGTGGPRPRQADLRRGAALVDLAAFVALVDLPAFDALDDLAGASSSPDALAVGCRVRAALASRTLASRAAMRSTTLSSATGVGAATISSPAALRSMRSRTWLR